MTVPTRHDRFARSVFSKPEHARGLLRAVLPRTVLASLDLSSLAVEDGTFVDAHLKERRTDVLFRTQLAGRDVFLYLLLEHQSTVDPLMALRLLLYMARIWERWLATEEQAGRAPRAIPAILPVVLYHGPEDWTAATELSQLYDLPAGPAADARALLPSFRFVLDDLVRQSDDQLRHREGVLTRLALLLLRHARLDSPEGFLRFVATLGDLLGRLSRVEDTTVTLTYILEVSEASPEAFDRAVTTSLTAEVREAAMASTAEQIRWQGARQLFLLQLREAFGELPAEVVARVEAAGPADLAAWSRRFRRAESLEDVFAAQGD